MSDKVEIRRKDTGKVLEVPVSSLRWYGKGYKDIRLSLTRSVPLEHDVAYIRPNPAARYCVPVEITRWIRQEEPSKLRRAFRVFRGEAGRTA